MNLTFSQFAEDYLSKEAERIGISLEAYVQMLIEKEAKRLFYIERSQPKVPQAIGRPSIAPDLKKCRELAAVLLPLYIRKREQYAANQAAYPDVYQEQENKLKKAVEENDLQTLLWFDRTQPWVKRHETK